MFQSPLIFLDVNLGSSYYTWGESENIFVIVHNGREIKFTAKNHL